MNTYSCINVWFEMMGIEPVTFLLWTEPQPVIKVNATLTADNAVQIKCKSQRVYGAKTIFELNWENDGTNYSRENDCDFKKENLLYLTDYTFTVSRLIKWNI